MAKALLCYMISCFLINHATAWKNAQFGSNADTSEKMVVDSKGSTEVLGNTSEVSRNASKKPMWGGGSTTHLQEGATNIGGDLRQMYNHGREAVHHLEHDAEAAIEVKNACGIYHENSKDDIVIIGRKDFFRTYYTELQNPNHFIRDAKEVQAIKESMKKAFADQKSNGDVFIYAQWDGTVYTGKIVDIKRIPNDPDVAFVIEKTYEFWSMSSEFGLTVQHAQQARGDSIKLKYFGYGCGQRGDTRNYPRQPSSGWTQLENVKATARGALDDAKTWCGSLPCFQ